MSVRPCPDPTKCLVFIEVRPATSSCVRLESEHGCCPVEDSGARVSLRRSWWGGGSVRAQSEDAQAALPLSCLLKQGVHWLR